MLFNDLITLLKKVKKPQEITEELIDELTSATISSQLSYLAEHGVAKHPIEAIAFARASYLQQLDHILIDWTLNIEEEDKEIPPTLRKV